MSLITNHACNATTCVCQAHHHVPGPTDEELWNLDCYLAGFIAGAIRQFREVGHGYPGELDSQEEWHAILDQIAAGLERYAAVPGTATSDDGAAAIASLKLLTEWFFALWD